MTTKEPSDNGLSTDEIARLRRLLDEDDIRQLATLYAQYMDHGYIDRLREIFTDDIVCEYGPYGVWEGIETVITNYEKVKVDLGGSPFAAMHAGSAHWIEFGSDNTARGRRQLMDFLLTRAPEENPILWLAMYDDQYRKTEDGWKVCHTRLQFFWPERHTNDDFPGDFP